MVVLSVGLEPPKGAAALAQTLGIELNKHGFAGIREFAPAGDQPARRLRHRARSPSPWTSRRASCRVRRRRPRPLALLAPVARHPHPRAAVPARARHLGGAAAHRRLHLPLRHQHRRRGGRAVRGGVRQDPARRRLGRREHVHLLSGLAAQDHRPHPGAQPEPRHRGLLHAAHPRAALHGDHPRGRAEPVPLRDGQHPRPGLLGARPRPRRRHPQGQGPGPHERGAGGAAGPAEQAAAAAHPRAPWSSAAGPAA